MSSNGASSTTGYDSSREEDCPLDLLHISGLKCNRKPGSSTISRNCPHCGVYLSAVVKEIVQLREVVEKHQQQYNDSIKQSYHCRELENRCDGAERECRLLRKQMKTSAECVQELKREIEKLQINCKMTDTQKETEVSVLSIKLSKLKEGNKQLQKEQEVRSIELLALKESIAEWKEKADVLQQKCKDLEERHYEGEQSWMKTREECKRLRDVLAKAFCKSKLTATEMDKVIVQQIPNDLEHIRTWVDFLNPLEMPQSMLSSEGMSPDDARGNVCHILLTWLEGKGGPGKPRTWGTLLDAMRRGPQYLQELADRAEYILLEELASLKMEFHVCVMCRRKLPQDPTEEATPAWVDEWVEDGVEYV